MCNLIEHLIQDIVIHINISPNRWTHLSKGCYMVTTQHRLPFMVSSLKIYFWDLFLYKCSLLNY